MPETTHLDTRTQMLISAAEMIATRGVMATSIRELAKHSGLPLGSVYYYFPGGKDQLIDEAIAVVGGRVERLLERSESPAAAIEKLVNNWRHVLTSGDFRQGCPILAVSIEEAQAGESAATRTAAATFTNWQHALSRIFVNGGVDPDRASGLAWMVTAALEGAVALSRSTRSLEPLDRVAQEIRSMIDAAMPSSAGPLEGAGIDVVRSGKRSASDLPA